jgi:hypothetical protein
LSGGGRGGTGGQQGYNALLGGGLGVGGRHRWSLLWPP